MIETHNIQSEFNKVFTKVRKLLENQRVTVDDFVFFLENVPGYGGKSLFDADISDLREATNLTSAFRIVRHRCSWFNYSFLGDIIEMFCEGEKEIVVAYKNYRAHLQSYCKGRAEKVPFKNGFGQGGKKDEVLAFKIDRNWEKIQIEQLEEVIFNLAHILEVQRAILHLYCVKEGSVQLTLLVPSYIPGTVFPLTTKQEEAMLEMGISDLWCGTYHFSCQVFHT